MKQVTTKEQELTAASLHAIEQYKQTYVSSPDRFLYPPIDWRDAGMFSWLTPMVDITERADTFQQDWHYPIKESDKAANITPVFEENWEKAHQDVPRPSASVSGLARAIWTTYRSPILLAVFSQLLVAAVEVVNSFLIYRAIVDVGQVDYSAESLASQSALWSACGNLALFMAVRIVVSLGDNLVQHVTVVEGMKLRTCLDHLLFKKTTRKNFDRDPTFDLAEVTNLTQVDSNKFADLFRMMPLLISIPMKITFGLAGLFLLMGWAMVPTLGVFFLILVANYFLAQLHEYNTANYLTASEKRIKFVSELFSNLKFIKMCGSENVMILRYTKLRTEELHWVFRMFIRWTMLNFVQMFGTGLFLLSMYVVKLSFSQNLTLGEAVTASILFNVFSTSIRFIAQIGVFLKECLISGKRICLFLLSEEVKPQSVTQQHEKKHPDIDLTQSRPSSAIILSNGWLYWQHTQNLQKQEQYKRMIKGGPAVPPPKQIEMQPLTKIAAPVESRTTPLLDHQHPLEEHMSVDFVLKGVNFEVKKGECVAIIGRTGAGKTALLSAILGEMHAAEGTHLSVHGSMAYVSQKPWITSSTIKDVILFGKEYNHERFEACLKFSGLEDDLKKIANGVDSVLGTNGVNVSGGQRTRLSIARALYADTEIYLLDDPISALDVEVGRYVMEKCVLEHLAKKTRVVVTHSLAFLGYFDKIYLMDEGRIVASGTFLQMCSNREFELFRSEKAEADPEQEGDQSVSSEDPLSEEEMVQQGEGNEPIRLARQNSKLSRQSSKYSRRSTSFRRQDSTRSRKSIKAFKEKAGPEIMKDEQKESGSVMTWKLLNHYIQAGGGWIFILMVMFSLSFKLVLDLYNVWYVQDWTSQHSDSPSKEMIREFAWNLGILAISITSVTMLQNYGLCRMNLHRSVKVAFTMMFSVMHSSINNFIDNIPTGRLLNRFVKDLSIMDLELLNSAAFFTFSFFAALTDCIAAVYGSSLWVLVFFLAYLALVLPYRKKSLVLNRESVRLRAITVSPLIQSVAEASTGFVTIRVFGTAPVLLSEFHQRQDEFFKNSVVSDAVTRWFIARLTLSSVVILVPSILLNLLVSRSGAGLFGFLMRFLIVVIQDINDFLNCYALFESKLVSLERCIGFCQIPPEVGYQDLEKTEASLREGILPPVKKTIKPNGQVWPSTGDVSIKGLKVKYRPGLPEVLKGLTLNIRHGTKVGIVGRTGAGKSTLLSCLYRHFEEYSGEVVIDGRELRDIDLKELRSNITIIPQDPYIFQDTVRANLDPLGHRTDTELENILKEINLWEKFKSKGALEALIEKGGSDLSQGEKQLLCLARALLHRNKLVLIDEATANIDANSEVIIQRLLEEKFKDCTMLMIAHRLNTVMKCDYILVLEQGNILEYGSLEDLKKDTKSHFYNMMNTLSDLQQALS